MRDPRRHLYENCRPNSFACLCTRTATGLSRVCSCDPVAAKRQPRAEHRGANMIALSGRLRPKILWCAHRHRFMARRRVSSCSRHAVRMSRPKPPASRKCRRSCCRHPTAKRALRAMSPTLPTRSRLAAFRPTGSFCGSFARHGRRRAARRRAEREPRWSTSLP
jgi:hypothetical protein